MFVKTGDNFLWGGQTVYTMNSQSFVSNLSPLITKNLLLIAKESRIYTQSLSK